MESRLSKKKDVGTKSKTPPRDCKTNNARARPISYAAWSRRLGYTVRCWLAAVAAKDLLGQLGPDGRGRERVEGVRRALREGVREGRSGWLEWIARLISKMKLLGLTPDRRSRGVYFSALPPSPPHGREREHYNERRIQHLLCRWSTFADAEKA